MGLTRVEVVADKSNKKGHGDYSLVWQLASPSPVGWFRPTSGMP